MPRIPENICHRRYKPDRTGEDSNAIKIRRKVSLYDNYALFLVYKFYDMIKVIKSSGERSSEVSKKNLFIY